MAGKKLNKTDRDYITKHHETLSVDDISSFLLKPVVLIEEFVQTLNDENHKNLRYGIFNKICSRPICNKKRIC